MNTCADNRSREIYRPIDSKAWAKRYEKGQSIFFYSAKNRIAMKKKEIN